MSTRLTRSRREKIVAGVCGGLAEYFEVDPTLVRIIFLVMLFATYGAALLLYFGMAIVMPKEKRMDWSQWEQNGSVRSSARRGAGGVYEPSAASAGGVGAAGGASAFASSSSAGAATAERPPTAERPRNPYSAPEPPPFGPYPEIEADLAGPKPRKNPTTLAAVLIGLGVLFLAFNLNIFGKIPWHIIWPSLLILLGIALMMGRGRRWRRW